MPYLIPFLTNLLIILRFFLKALIHPVPPFQLNIILLLQDPGVPVPASPYLQPQGPPTQLPTSEEVHYSTTSSPPEGPEVDGPRPHPCGGPEVPILLEDLGGVPLLQRHPILTLVL